MSNQHTAHIIQSKDIQAYFGIYYLENRDTSRSHYSYIRSQQECFCSHQILEKTTLTRIDLLQSDVVGC